MWAKNRPREALCHNAKSAPSGIAVKLMELPAMPDGAES